jgi:hypothetical protein
MNMESDGSVIEGFLYNGVIFWVFVEVFERLMQSLHTVSR